MALSFPCRVRRRRWSLGETLFEGVGRVAAGLEQAGAGLRLSVQTRHIHVQQTADVLSQTSRHHDLLNISPVDHVHHRADRIMRGIDGDATSRLI
jgi:hypothetical protein